MITTKKMNSFKQKHFTGESTDNKPTTCGVNSLFVEIDTGDTYFFDGYQWIKAELPEHGGITPSGNIEITENGENINVAQYATATVNVAGGGGFINPLIHFNISFENNVTECNMIWEPEPTIVFTTDFAFLVDDQNKLFTRPQLEVFFDSEFPFEWGISLISPYYQEGNSIWILAITASSETQEIKSVTSNDCQVMFNAPTFACAIPNGQSEATVNIVIGNTPK